MKIYESYTQVTCPLSEKTEKVFYRRITDTDIINVNGCDNCNGSTTCKKCIEQVKSELFSR